MTEQLKPCPFCGSKARKGGGYDFHKVGCSNDECLMYGEFQYLERWNSRPYENKIKADAVREARQDIINNVVIPKAPPIGGDYYKAAIRHAVSNLEAYADKLERGE